MLRKGVRTVLEALFRVVFTYESHGVENVPAEGPAVLAANHPSYLDPILLSLPIERPIRFMAWDAILRVPLLGALLRLFGAFPVDVRRGQGGAAYAKARALVGAGELVGLFPEGRRSRSGWMEPTLREGAARLAWETGAPLVPASITGAFRAWPYFRALPEPARVRVRFHEAIDPAPYRARPQAEAVAALLEELRRRVERTLMPGVKADLKMSVLYRMPAPWPRLHETIPALGLALLVFWKARSFSAVWPCYAYIGYLLLDLLVIPQRRVTKWLRNSSALVFTLLYGGWALPTLGLPPVAGGVALLAVVAGATFPYLYARGRVATCYMEGMVSAALLDLGVLYYAATGLGPHVALPLFAAAYAWERRTVFSRYAAPLLAGYAIVTPAWLGGGVELVPHAMAGLLAWVVVSLLPRGATEASERPSPPSSVLGLEQDRDA
jgi:1-acyl-sn-glycerol-3-phosphate acyltransferase